MLFPGRSVVSGGCAGAESCRAEHFGIVCPPCSTVYRLVISGVAPPER